MDHVAPTVAAIGLDVSGPGQRATDFSRIEAGRLHASFEPTDLATETAQLASVFRSAIERAGLVLEIRCPPLPELVYVDRDLWEKIVSTSCRQATTPTPTVQAAPE